jgi:hypothetical protein
MMGGNVTVTSEPGKGSLFMVRLPRDARPVIIVPEDPTKRNSRYALGCSCSQVLPRQREQDAGDEAKQDDDRHQQAPGSP